MRFYDFATLTASLRPMFRSLGDPLGHTTEADFYQQFRDRVLLRDSDESLKNLTYEQQHFLLATFTTEWSWVQDKRPYYKLYPGIIKALLNTDISVPAKMVHAPLPRLNLRLPENHGISELTQSEVEMRSVMISELDLRGRELVDNADSETAVAARFREMATRSTRGFQFLVNHGMGYGRDSSIPFVASSNADDPSYIFMSITDEEAPFEDNLRKWIDSVPEYKQEHEAQMPSGGMETEIAQVEVAVRLAVGACLIGTNVLDVVEADVLDRHVMRYRAATDSEEKEKLAQKAVKRGKRGWLLGREIDLPSHIHDSSTAVGTGRQLTSSHIRRGHFHTVRHGRGKALTKIAWFRPTWVRKDLPRSTVRRGYRTGVEA
jgi:hypothetical protein